MQPQHIAFFGLGLMGYPMAEHLLKAGHMVHLFNRSKSKSETLFSKYPKNAIIASTPKDALSKEVKYVITMLFDYNSLKDTLLTNDVKPLLKDKIWINMMTISSRESKELDETTKECGGLFIEAPVLGTNTVAQAGKLQILIGCSKLEFEQLKQAGILDPLGALFYIGDKPKAIKMKLCFNLVVGSLTAVFANAVAMVEKEDLSIETYMEIMRSSAFYFKYMDLKLPRMLNRKYENPNFTTSGLLKDFGLILEEAKSAGVYEGLVQEMKAIIEKTVKQSKTKGDGDFASIYEIMNPPQKKE